MKRDLKDNINALKGLRRPEVTAALPKLHTWKNNRNGVFHNFAELMLQDVIEKKSEEGYRHLVKISKEEWYHRMEESFILTQTNLPVQTH